jgi:integrase
MKKAEKTTSKSDFIKQKEEYLYRYKTEGKYYAIIRHDGKLKKRSLKTTDKAIAKRNLKEYLEELHTLDMSQEKMTLEALIKEYEDGLGALDKSTIKTRQGILRVIKEDWDLNILVRDIKISEVKTWIAKLPELRGRELSKSTINEYIRVLRQIFQIAVDNRAISTSPASGLKELKRDRPLRETPTFDEFQQILADIRTNAKYNAEMFESANFIEFMGLAGLGNSEVANLKWSDVNWKTNKIKVYRNKTDRGFLIPIFPELKPFIEKLYEDSIKEGNIFSIQGCIRSLKAACKRLKLIAYDQRSLRRMFITDAIERGIDFPTIASWQGHTDGGRLVATTYGHLRTEHADKQAEKMVYARPKATSIQQQDDVNEGGIIVQPVARSKK